MKKLDGTLVNPDLHAELYAKQAIGRAPEKLRRVLRSAELYAEQAIGRAPEELRRVLRSERPDL